MGSNALRRGASLFLRSPPPPRRVYSCVELLSSFYSSQSLALWVYCTPMKYYTLLPLFEALFVAALRVLQPLRPFGGARASFSSVVFSLSSSLKYSSSSCTSLGWTERKKTVSFNGILSKCVKVFFQKIATEITLFYRI